MRTVYAIQFNVDQPEGTSAAEVFQRLHGKTANWVEYRYEHRWGTEVDVAFNGMSSEPLEGHEITTSLQSSDDKELATLRWAHPGDDDPSLIWRTEANLALEEEAIEVDVRVRLTSPRFELRPIPNYFVGRPRFVTDVLQELPCRIGTEPVPLTVQKVGVGDVSQFVNNVLEDEQRTLPVILLSQDTWTEQPYTDPGELMYRVLGHAHVAVIDKQAGFELTGLVGKRFSCWDGAIRVYWPGFDYTEDGYHPLFLPDRMDFHADRGEPIEDHLFQRLSAIAVLRHTHGEITERVRQYFSQRRRAELATLREELEEKQREENEELAQREDQLLKALIENDELADENERLRKELEATQENLNDVLRQIGSEGEEQEVYEEPAEEEFQPSSVLEALMEADERYSDWITIWDTAYESAEDSDFERPEEVFSALEALAELSEEYFRSLAAEESMGPWEKFFAERGLRYRPSEHETTLNMYGDQRDFTHEGETRRMERHLRLGGGSRRNCVQIYFLEDEDEETIHVGYCGRHLDYASQTT